MFNEQPSLDDRGAYFNSNLLMMLYIFKDMAVEYKKDVLSYIFNNTQYPQIKKMNLYHDEVFPYDDMVKNIYRKYIHIPHRFDVSFNESKEDYRLRYPIMMNYIYHHFDANGSHSQEEAEIYENVWINYIDIQKYITLFVKSNRHKPDEFYDLFRTIFGHVEVSQFMSIGSMRGYSYLYNLYSYMIYNNVILINWLQSRSMKNYVTYIFANITLDNMTAPHINNNSSCIFLDGPEIDKDFIALTMTNISPKSVIIEPDTKLGKIYSTDIQRKTYNNMHTDQILTDLRTKITNEFQKMSGGVSNIYLLKYAHGSTGLGIHLLSRLIYQHNKNLFDKILSNILISIEKYHRELSSEINNINRLTLILQEYIQSNICEPCESVEKCFCTATNDFNKSIQSVLRETVPVHANIISQPYDTLIKDNIGKENDVACLLKYNHKTRIFPIVKINKRNGKLYVSLILPEIFSVEWMIPFGDNIIIPAKDNNITYDISTSRYVSNSLTSNDTAWRTFSAYTSSLKQSPKAYECIKKYFYTSVSSPGQKQNIIEFMNSLSEGILKKICQINVAKIPDRVFYLYSMDIIVSTTGKFYILDINNAGAPMNDDICYFLFDKLFDPKNNSSIRCKDGDTTYALINTTDIDANTSFKIYNKISNIYWQYSYIYDKSGYATLKSNGEVYNSFDDNVFTNKTVLNDYNKDKFMVYELSSERPLNFCKLANSNKMIHGGYMVYANKYEKYMKKLLNITKDQ